MSDVEKIKATLQRELAELEQTRDELKVKLHLAAADARDEYDKLETHWLNVKDEIGRVGTLSKEPIHELGAAARKLVGELRSGYARVREQLKA
jgi:hypothetical protein